MPTTSDLLITYYGDDFTGSTDAMESLTLAGLRTVMFVRPPTPDQLARYQGLRAVGVAGLTRSMTPDPIEAELRPALTALKSLGAPITHYKVCSTFDSSPQIGSIGRAIDVARDIFPDAPFIPLLVGAPALGRYCVFGNLFARAGRDSQPHRLDRHPSMSRHPVTPADESDLRAHLSRQTAKRVALFDILTIALSPDVARTAFERILTSDQPDVVLFDVLYEHQLDRIGRLIDSYASPTRPLFAVGSSGLSSALGAHWASIGRITPATAFPNPGPAKPLLVASGSCSPVTESQIACALKNGFAEVPLDSPALASDDPAALTRATHSAISHLRAGRSVIIHTTRGPSDPRILARPPGADTAQLFGHSLARVILNVLEHIPLRRLLIAGGDTSGHLAHALGIESIEMIAPLTPGAPLCRVHAPNSPADGLEVNFKGGQVGGPDYFDLVRQGRPDITNPGIQL